MSQIATRDRVSPEGAQRGDGLDPDARDGARLAARLWLPEDAEADPVPAVLEYIPYPTARFHPTARRGDTNPYVAGHGYACIRVDLRGSGDSDGILRDE